MKKSSFTLLVCLGVFSWHGLVLAMPSALPQAGRQESTVHIEFVDSATGFAIQPESITARPERAGGAERRFRKEHVSTSGRAGLLLEEGRHTVTASSPKYQSISAPLQVEENSPYKIKFVLDPIEQPQELRPEAVELLLRDDATLFQGFIGDAESGQPLSGVSVRSLPSGVETSTDARGFFRIHVPLQSQEERTTAPASLIWEKPGYRSKERQYLELWSRGDSTYRMQLERGGGREVIDQRTRQRNSSHNEKLSENASETNVAVTAEILAGVAHQDELLTLQATVASNATVRVPRNIRVLEPDGIIWYVTFNYYVKNTLPSEWIRSWNTNSLNAGAVAVRGYAMDRFNNRSSTSAHDICGTSDCQNFDPGDTGGATDRATDYTEGYVMVNSTGKIAGLEYSSENNSLDRPCGDGFTAPTGGCLYDPLCVGKPRNGHGRGMCQYGSRRWGNGQNGLFPARDWIWILKHYYPGLTLVKGAVLVVGDDVKARTANDCDVRICDNGGISAGVGCTLITTKSAGETGVIIGGPTLVTNDGKGFTWYKVQWNDVDSTVGWSCENFLDRVFSIPTAPTSLIATAVGSQINLSWTDTSDVEIGFLIERAPGTNGPWIEIADLPANTTSYSDLSIDPGSKWFYRVRAYNANGNTSYTSIANATTAGSPPTIAVVSDRTVAPGTLVTITNIGTASDRAQLLTDFESFIGFTANGKVLFRNPLNSSSTTNFLAKTNSFDIAALMDVDYPVGGQAAGNVLMVKCQFTNASNPWLRLTTAGATNFPNPVIDFTKKLRFDIYTDKSIKIALGCRETTNAVGTAIGSNGGTSGAIEWAGATNTAGTAPMPNRSIAASNWTTVTFNFTNEVIRNFSGGNGTLSTASGLGVLEHLAIVPTAGTNVYNIYLDNFSVLYPRSLTYSLATGAPTNATINTNTGVFSWTPLVSQAPSTNVISVIATDNSVPALKATNTFTVYVSDASVVITNQPQSVTTNVGSNVTFIVGASGSSLKYQWHKDAANLTGKTNSSLALTNVQITNAGSYSVIVSNASHSVTSSPAVLTVMAPIAVSSAPVSRTNIIGDNAFFSVTATGTNLTYQWRFNGNNLSGQTTSAINIPVNGATNAGTYSVVLSSPYATNVTNSAVLSVPYDDLVKIAQWNFNSQTPDANLTTGTTTASTGSGSVTVVGGATNRFGSGTSSDVASLGSDNTSWVITNFPATSSGNKTRGIQVNASTLGYQNIAVTWEHYNDGQSSRYARFQYTTNGSSWVDGDVIANTNYGKFLFRSSDLSEVSGVMENTNFAVRILTEWQSTATGSGSAAYVPANTGSTYSSNAVIRFDMLSVLGAIAPATITSQPQSLILASGQSAVFTVTATGVNLTYQWQKDGVDLQNGGNISGAQSASLTIANVGPADSGNFTALVGSGGGLYTVPSEPASLTVGSGNRYWSGNGASYGGTGTWNTTSNQWSLSTNAPFNLAWINANNDIANLGGTAGTVTIGAPVTANTVIFETGGYTIAGTNALTFAGDNPGINNPGANNSSSTNLVTISAPLVGPVLTKNGGGRLNMNNTGNSIGKWVVNQGAITAASGNNPSVLFGSVPSQLVADFVTLDGGGLGFGASGSMALGSNRGIYLGIGGGRLGNNGTGGIITIDGPISGPGDLHFPGVTEWPGQVQGDNATFVISNTNNNYGGQTRIATAEVRLGNNQVFPLTTTLNITNGSINGRLNLNGFHQTVTKVILDSTTGNSRIFDSVGGGSLSAGEFNLRRSAYTGGASVSAVLAGSGFVSKTTAGNISLSAANTYTGDTIISQGTITIDAIGRFGSGAGVLNLAGGGIILSTNRPESNTLMNPALLSADSSIANGDVGTSAVLFRHGGTWTTTGGTLSIRNTTSTGAGSFDVLLTNGFTFTQPIVIGLAGDKPCQLTSFNPSGASSDQTFAGQISGIGSFRRSVSTGSGGRTVFTAANTYSGPTIVETGTLVANNATGSATGSSNVIVTGTGNLAGSGTIAGNVSVSSGTISAGDGVGLLTLQNGLNLSGGGTNVWELATLTDVNDGVAGTDFDQLVLTGGQLELSGSSRLILSFNENTTPNDFDQFWRGNHTWKIINLNGASNSGNATFASIVNGTYSCGVFTTEVDGSGNIILRFTTSISSTLWWSGNGSSLGGAGTWDTTNTRWGATNAAPFSIVWNNALTNTATFAGTGGSVTVGSAISVNRIVVSSASYSFGGSSTVTFIGNGAGVDTGTRNFTNSYTMAGAVMTKSGTGRLHLLNTGNAVTNWVVNEGIMSIQGQSHLGPDPASLRPDFITLDGGGLGWEGTSPSLQGNRGLTLGVGGGKLGIRGGATLTISAPITGPGGLTFPGFSGFHSTGIYGANEPFTLSNTSNNYQGNTTVSTGTLTLGASGVLPDTTTLTLSGGKLNLAGFNETVATVVVNNSSSQITGAGTLTASTFDLRNSGVISAVFAGSGIVIKTTANNATLNGTNTYTGDTIISQGTITIDAIGRFGSGAGVLNLAGGGIILSTNRPESNTLMNPALLSAHSSIANGDVGTSAVQFRHGGTWTTTGGTLSIRNTTSTGAGSFDVLLTNGFTFIQPIVIGLAGDKPCQLTSFNPSGANSDQTFAGQISGIGSFRRSVSTGSGGRTIFTANNTYSGVTTVDGGTLMVNNPGPGSGTGTNTVTVNTNGVLVGNGIIGGNVVVSGGATISAGDIVGLLTLQNGLTLTNAGTNVWDLTLPVDDSSGVAGVDFDQLVVTSGHLRLGGNSRLALRFSESVGSPSVSDPFWRYSHNWTIVKLDGGQNTNNTKFATITNPTNSAGYFSTTVSNGSVILTFTSYSTNDLFWSGDGTSLGGAGTWNTTSNRWANSSGGPFNQVWTNASGKSALFESIGETVTLGTNITVKNMTVGLTGYSFDGTNTLTFSGTGAGVDYRVTTSGDGNKLGFTCPITGTLMTKTGAGRMHLSNTGNTVNKWAINEGIISVAGVSRFGPAPGSLVPDFITLNGGGIGFDGTSPTLDANRGVTLGTNNVNKMGVRASNVTLTLAAPLTGPGGISFPGYSSFPTLIHGGGGTFVFSNTNNNYQGGTTVSVGTLKLGAAGVLPNTTTLTLTGSGKVDLNSFDETVANVVIDGGNASILGTGILTATNGYEVRRSADVTAVLGGNSSLTKTTTNTVTLSAANTYSGGTLISEGTLLVNNSTGSGTGTGIVTVSDPAGILGGTGIIAGNVVVNPGGSISPGNGLGALTMNNGLNLTNGGNLIWELGALTDNANGIFGVDFDKLAITGGQLRLGASSTLTIQFTGTATPPDSTVPFWQSNHTWKVIVLSGSATNVNNQTFSNLVYAVNDAGSFSNYISGTNLMLTFLAGVFDPQAIVEPVRAIAQLIRDGASTGVQMTWPAIPGNRYEVQATTDLDNPNWRVLAEIVAQENRISVTDFPPADEPQQFYRLMPK